MTSTNIYTSEKTLSYVYRLDNPITGEIYIGYREANKLPSHLDLPNYKTSSKYVKPRFEEFNRTILAEFFLGTDAYDHEQLTIYENWGNPLLLNKQHYYGKSKWKSEPCSDETKTKISVANKGKPCSDETRLKLSIAGKGRKLSDEHKANISTAQKGKIQKPHSAETKAKISAAGKGRKHSEETKSKMSASGKGKHSPLRGTTQSAETRLKHSIALKGKPKQQFFSFIDSKKTYNKANLSKYFPELRKFL